MHHTGGASSLMFVLVASWYDIPCRECEVTGAEDARERVQDVSGDQEKVTRRTLSGRDDFDMDQGRTSSYRSTNEIGKINWRLVASASKLALT